MITHSVRSYVCVSRGGYVCVYVVGHYVVNFAKLIAVSKYIDVFPWDLDTMILR